ncbi:hypothetical protein [Alicyclobacillus dauci]|uniref:Phage ABA sandwich domain-containing protein n=1 Tax=Alicyclobacillus dauci TaxID=1475485 RepID=A0ABY6YXE7_9BACL|nr:hypothetical protein [Alicyclobacillus dauci]WAH35017.1 hypothetical protein NZD86_11825 [Alicyclobacillus dauci]
MDVNNAKMKQLLEALPQIRELVSEQAEVEGYGSASCVDDPRDFVPDFEMCSEKEINAWKAACELAEKGESVDIPRHQIIRDGEGSMAAHIAYNAWGLGTYKYRDPEMIRIRDIIDAVLQEESQ